MKNKWLERASPWLLTLVLLVLWEAAVRVFGISQIVMPSASKSLYAIYEFRVGLWSSALTTLYATVIGFGIAVVFGVLMGVAIGLWRPVYVALYPLMVAFNAIPKVVIVPIFVLWIGPGLHTASLTAFILCFFPVVVNMAVGMATIEPELRDVLRALGAKDRDIVLKVGIPRSLPYLFASLKIAITLAFVGAVIAETVAGSAGIGNLMLVASSNFNTPLMFAGIIVIAAMATGMYGIFAVLDQRFTGWATRGSVSFATAGG
jgi:NitT/TauT family transport system permease protein